MQKLLLLHEKINTSILSTFSTCKSIFFFSKLKASYFCILEQFHSISSWKNGKSLYIINFGSSFHHDNKLPVRFFYVQTGLKWPLSRNSLPEQDCLTLKSGHRSIRPKVAQEK